ncbi:phosphate acyltransferase PlsX [Bacterioplanes sanyensis]|uniref:Phosphate acyltransferase n=1 Tax=Bacterioplanes sanyensis TaxID=1249553 RepID=A0A222FM81_9GAMM|nr:phosphate acyltransferase PlsX [Bacterioplanes sanyensis]ASP39880.1 phosphate acyltransferase PlsX [Bacterioplanes sanyensis]
MFTIAVDVMGGDLGPRVAFKACRKWLANESKDSQLLLVMTADHQQQAQEQLADYSGRVRFVLADSVISMSDSPAQALRHKISSTMAMALQLHADGEADAVLSVGNTGALMALARQRLGMYADFDRPALAACLPTRQRPVLMLDLGANLDSSAQQLEQFAALGLAWQMMQGNAARRMALLNIGQESCKGTSTIKDAAERLRERWPEQFVGFCEGTDIYTGELDVVVCDGFVGNVALKTSEGLSSWLSEQIQREFQRHFWGRSFYPLLRPIIARLLRRFNASRYAGALLLGVQGMVVKSHGNSDWRSLNNALCFVHAQLQQGGQAAYARSLASCQ